MSVWARPFQGWNTLGVFFLAIDVPIEVSGVCLNIADQVIHIQTMLFSHISLDFSSLSFKFLSKFATSFFFPLHEFYFSSYLMCNPGN